MKLHFLFIILLFYNFSNAIQLKNAEKVHHSAHKTRAKADNSTNGILILKGKEIKRFHRITHKLLKLCNGNIKECQLEVRNKQGTMSVNRQKEINEPLKMSNEEKRKGMEKENIQRVQLKQKNFLENDEINNSYSISDELKKEILNAEKKV